MFSAPKSLSSAAAVELRWLDEQGQERVVLPREVGEAKTWARLLNRGPGLLLARLAVREKGFGRARSVRIFRVTANLQAQTRVRECVRELSIE